MIDFLKDTFTVMMILLGSVVLTGLFALPLAIWFTECLLVIKLFVCVGSLFLASTVIVGATKGLGY